MTPDTVPFGERIRLACGELSRRLRAGDDCRAEDYLGSDATIDGQLALELLYTEFIVRQELGQQPRPEDWYQRFPQWQADLAELFQIHEYICHESVSRLESRGTMTAATEDTHAEDGPPSDAKQFVGGFQVLDEIARGGMGVVYKARQLSVDRVVAVKMILSGEHASAVERERFRNEAQAVASLQHPNIAQAFEAGDHHGQPYLVMEFVDGPSLEIVLAKAPLTPDSAAALVATLADAIEYAHEHGIIHRDLKPSNILLAPDGTPKITDFGLAKRVHGIDPSPATHTGVLLGTPSYLPPEQATGNPMVVGPQSDVYALGALLYESMTGRPPLVGDTLPELLQRIQTADPVPPRRIEPKIPRDLETICLKCLEKVPGDRYASARQLADDLRRYALGQPIKARPSSIYERIGKWARRRPAITALLVAIALVAAVSAAAVGWQVRRAMIESRASREVSSFLGELFAAINPALTRGRTITVKEIVDEAAARLETSTDLHPRVLAGLHDALGTTYFRIGDLKQAEVHLREAIKHYRSDRGADDPLTLKMCGNLALTLKELDRLDEAEALARQNLELSRRSWGESHSATELLQTQLAVIVDAQGKTEEAERLYRQAWAAMDKKYGPDHPTTLMALGNLASWLLNNGQLDEAETLIDSCWDRHCSVLGRDHPSTLVAMQNKCAWLGQAQRWEESETLSRELVTLSQQVFGPEALLTLCREVEWSKSLFATGRPEEAIEQARHAYRGLLEQLGPAHADTLDATETLVAVLGLSRHWEEAESIALQTYEDVVKTAGPRHSATKRAAMLLVNLYESWNRPEDQQRWQDISEGPV